MDVALTRRAWVLHRAAAADRGALRSRHGDWLAASRWQRGARDGAAVGRRTLRGTLGTHWSACPMELTRPC